MAEALPLISLRPALDAHNAWAALLLETAGELTGAALAELLHRHGLADLLNDLPCVAWIEPDNVDPGWGATLPKERLHLCFPAARGAEAGRGDCLESLKAAGFGLMAAGLPAPGQRLHAGITSLALRCLDTPAAGDPEALLLRLPGPHLALDAGERCPGACRFHWLAGHYARHEPIQPVLADVHGRGMILKLLTLIHTEADPGVIEDLVKRNASLSYKLLKLANSVAFSPGRPIDSFGQAIALLGYRQLQRWLMLLLFVSENGNGLSNPLLPQAARRGCLADGLARQLGWGREDVDRVFMVGMFSLLDQLLGKPLADLLVPLNLPEEMLAALLEARGRFHPLLRLTQLAEERPTTSLQDQLNELGLTRAQWTETLLAAVRWAAAVEREF